MSDFLVRTVVVDSAQFVGTLSSAVPAKKDGTGVRIRLERPGLKPRVLVSWTGSVDGEVVKIQGSAIKVGTQVRAYCEVLDEMVPDGGTREDGKPSGHYEYKVSACFALEALTV